MLSHARPFAVALAVLSCGGAVAQVPADCSCAATLDWVATTFAANDAGYPAAIEARGREAYDAYLGELELEARTVTAPPDCEALLTRYLRWFRKGHLSIYRNGQGVAAPAGPESTDDELRERYAPSARYTLDTSAFANRLRQQPGADALEGFYGSGPYEVAVVRADSAGLRRYLGVMTNANGGWWQPGQIKFELFPDGVAGGSGSGTIRMRDHSAATVQRVEVIEGQALDLYPVSIYVRRDTSANLSPAAETFLADRQVSEPVFRQLSARTAYLRVPDFDISQQAPLDSLLRLHHADLTSTPNLVIDMRGNGGGYDATYDHLLDYLYTTPVRQVSVALRSTPLNNARNQRFLAEPDMPEDVKAWVRDIVGRLAATDAEWVPMSDSTVDIMRRDTVYAYPARVAIITDETNGSSAEQFLLDARQSLKVKTFGAKTFGVLDVSNMNEVESPCGDYTFNYAVSRSYRIPAMGIDGAGLAPDFYLDEGVPRWRWVAHVEEVLEGR